MAANSPGTLEGGDLDRLEAQRKALSGLLARFTADRDALITTVQACEQRVAALAARLDTGTVGGAIDESSEEVRNPTELQALRVVLEELRREQQDAITNARKTAEHAMFRADAALQSLEELRQSPAPAESHNAGTLFARFTADRDALMSAVAETQQRLADLAARLDDLTTGSPAAAITAGAAAVEPSLEVRQLAAQALQRSDEAMRAFDDLAPTVHRDVEELAQRAAAEHEAVQAALHTVEEQLAGVIEHVHDARREAQEADLLQRIDALAGAQQAGESRVAELAEQWPAQHAALIGALDASEQRMRQLVQQTHDAQDSQAEIANAALSTMQQAMDGRSAEIVARVAADRDTLINLLQDSEQRLALLAARLDANDTYPLELDELRRVIDQVRQTQHEFDLRVTGTEEGLQQTANVFARLEELATVQRAQQAQATELATRLTTERESLLAMVSAGEQRLTALADLLDASDADSPQIEGLRDLVERVQHAHQEAAVSLREENERAAAQSAEALQRIDALAAALQDRDAQMALSATQWAADREALVALVHGSDRRLVVLADRLDALEASAQPQREAVRELAQEMRAEQQRVTEELRAAAASRADSVQQQIEALTDALRARNTHAADLEARIGTDREALVALLQDADERLAALSARLDSDQAVTPEQLDVVRRLAEEIRQQQQESGVLFQAANEQALAGIETAQQRLEELTGNQDADRDQTAALAERLAADHQAFNKALTESEQRFTAWAARFDGIESHVHPEFDALHSLVERTSREQEDRLEHVQAEVADVAHRLERAVSAQESRDAEVRTLHTGLTADHEALVGLVQDAAQKLDTFAARLETADTHVPAQLTELGGLIDQVQHAHRDLAARVAATEASLTHTAAALHDLDTLRLAHDERDVQIAALTAHVVADRQALANATQDAEQRFTALAARIEGADAHAPAQLAELRSLIDQVHRVHHDIAVRVTNAEDSLARSSDALRHLDALQAAHNAHEAQTAEMSVRITADRDALAASLHDAERHLAVLVARLDAIDSHSPAQLPELRSLIDQIHHSHHEVAARVTTAEHSLAQAIGALQRVEELTAAQHAREANATELLTRVTADHDALVGLVQEAEQRLAAVAARLDGTDRESASQLAALRGLIDEVHDAHQQVAARVAAAEDSLADTVHTLRDARELIATHDTRQAHTAEAIARLVVDREALISLMQGSEQRAAALTARLDTLEASGGPPVATLKERVERIDLDRQHDAEALRDTTQRALLRADEGLQRIEELAATGQTRDHQLSERVAVLTTDHAELTTALDEATRRLSASIHELHQAQQHVDTQVHAATEQVASMQRAAETQIAGLVAHVNSDRDALVGLVEDTEQRLAVLAAKLDDVESDHPAQLAGIHDLIEQLRQAQETAESRLDGTTARALARADELLEHIESVAAAQQTCDQHREEIAVRFTADHAALSASMHEATQRLTASIDAVHETQEQVERQVHAASDQLTAVQHAAETQLAEFVAQVATDRENLVRLVEHAEQRLTALAERVDAFESSNPDQIAGIRDQIEQLGRTQHDANTRLDSVTTQTAERAAELVQRVEALAAAQQTSDRDDKEAAARLFVEQGALTASLDAATQRLGASIDELHRAHQQVDAQVHAATERLTTVQQSAETQIAELVAHVAADRDALVGLVQDAEVRLSTLAARVEDVAAHGPTQLADLRELIEELRHAQQEVVSRLDTTATQALTQAEETRERLETITVAQQVREQRSDEVTARLTADHATLAASLAQLHDTLQHADAQLQTTAEQLADVQHAAEAQIGELVAHVAADRDALVGLVQHTEQRLAAVASRVDEIEAQGPAQLADLGACVEQLQQAQRDAEVRLDASAAQAMTYAEDGLQRIEMLVATQQLRDEHITALRERAASDHEALVGLQRDSEHQLAVLATRLDGAEAGNTPQLEEFRQQLEQLHVEQREAEARVRAVAEEVAYRSRDAGKAEVAELRTALRHLTVNVRRLEVQLQHLGVPETDAPGGTIAELAARVGALEAAIATSPPATNATGASAMADTPTESEADTPPQAAEVVPLAKSDGIGQRMSHVASSAHRDGGRSTSSAVSRAPTRQETVRRPTTPSRQFQQASRRRDRAALGGALVVLGVLAAAGVLRFWEQPSTPPRSAASSVSVAGGGASGAATIDHKIAPHDIVAPQHVFQTHLSVEPAFPGDTILSKPRSAPKEVAATGVAKQ